MSLLDKAKENPIATAVLVVVVLVLVFWIMGMFSSEGYVNRTVNMIGFRHPDPIEYKYTNRERAPNGMDDNDYYLENKMTHYVGLGPELLNEAAFTARVIAEDTMPKESAPAAMDVAEDTENFVGGLAY